jgi:phenylalanyl-tRNA synthetase alpha chain
MNLNGIKDAVVRELAGASSREAAETIRLKYLGRKGELTEVLRSLKDLPEAERRILGAQANALRGELEALFATALGSAGSARADDIDITLPGHEFSRGHLHPLTVVQNEVERIFSQLGFSVIDGPEMETEYYNFDALNIPAHHPARDMWDTFWVKQPDALAQKKAQRLLMRTHTSPVQVRYMEKHEPPFQIIVPGRVFRYEATDASHEINFYQVEGLMVGKDISLSNFKFIIEHFLKRVFGPGAKARYRPSYFPFVEPGLEIDVWYRGAWLEIMGAGMVHPRVFEYAHYNPHDWQGFAFGVGLDRIAMIKYGIPDIRLFYGGDVRLTEQF